MSREFQKEAAQRLLRAVLVRAISDAADPNVCVEDKTDALDFLFTERSDLFIMANGVSNVDAFRAGMRDRMAAPVVTIYAENGRRNTKFTQQEAMEQAA